MSNYIDILDNEITNIEHLLSSIPFSQKRLPQDYFLRIYKLNHESIIRLNDQPNKFPIESSKLLKLGISLGNLIKSLQLDEELYQQQQLQQQNFINNLNNMKNKNKGNHTTATNKTSEYNPFSEQQRTTISSLNQQQPVYQVKFIKNLLNILKNFDVGSNLSYSGQLSSISTKLQEISSSQSHSTVNQLNRKSSSNSLNSSPIKISSKQLLIEKLEINIKLDNLFIYKILFKLILNIFKILQKNLFSDGFFSMNNGDSISTDTNTHSSANNTYDESSSIFSSNSVTSSEFLISLDEYLKMLKQILNRISIGITEPFSKLILNEFVEYNINKDFINLINEL